MAFKSTDFKGHFNTFTRKKVKNIASLEELKKEALYNDQKGFTEFFILINCGMRSSKRIAYFADTNTFDVHNEIDDSYEEDLTEEQLRNETHIVVAIENGALYKYEF